MILFTDEEIETYINHNQLKSNDYIVIDDISKYDEGTLDYEKKIFVKNLIPTKISGNNNTRVLLSCLRNKDINIKHFLHKNNLREESFYLNYLEWMSADETNALYNAVGKELSISNPRDYLDLGRQAAETEQSLHKFIYLFVHKLSLEFIFALISIFNRNFNNIVSVQYATSNKTNNILNITLLVKTFENFSDDWDMKHFYWFAGNLQAVPSLFGYTNTRCKYVYYSYNLKKLLSNDYAHLDLIVTESDSYIFIDNIPYAKKVFLKKESIKCYYPIKLRILTLINGLIFKNKYSLPKFKTVFSHEVIDCPPDRSIDSNFHPCYQIHKDLFDAQTGDFILKEGEIFNAPYFRFEIDVSQQTKDRAPKYLSSKKKLNIYLDNIKSQCIELENARNSALKEASRAQKSETAVKELNERLNRADKLKDEFLAKTTHELKTPISNIISIAESMIDDSTTNEVKKINLNHIAVTGRRLSTLIDDILDYSRLRHKDIILYKRPVNIKASVDVIIAIFSPQLMGNNIAIINNLPDDLPMVFSDENRIHQIFINLIHNSIKFTPKGKISISAKIKNNMLEVSVEDTGIGIPENMLESIFNSYEQADSPGSMNRQGTGIGLSIVKKLLELHNGTIKAESRQGNGSIFRLTLPLASGQVSTEYSHAAESYPVQSNIAHEYHQLDLNSLQGNEGNILIVDDELMNLYVMKNILMHKNYSIEFLQDSREALDKIQTGIYDLIILDINMPYYSGYDLSRAIRQTYSIYELPIMLLTINNNTADIIAGFDSGANDYLTKPVRKEDLIARINTLINLKKIVKKGKDIEYKLLQNKMNPHFLFNSLNIIYSHITRGSQFADILVLKLSEIYRYILNKAHIPLIPFIEEWNFVINYLEFQKYHFSGQLDIQCYLGGNFQDVLLPPLTIEPIVENCIIHGFRDTHENCIIEIHATRIDELVSIIILDNGDGIQNADLSFSSLKNIIKRLRHYYKSVELHIENRDTKGAKASLIFSIDKTKYL